jgi:2,4-dienoyl-CoA reductase-like NADH-dependent reductase (Old Yellow Enzyme family)
MTNKEAPMHINRKIERFLTQYNMPATKFGRLVARDPRLVLDMRRGRELRPPMIACAETFMAVYANMAANNLAIAA